MANIKSQEKRNRQNEKLRMRNKAVRSEVNTRIHRALSAAQSGDQDAARDALRLAQKKIDKAAAKGVIPPNRAARKKSRLTRQVEDLLA